MTNLNRQSDLNEFPMTPVSAKHYGRNLNAISGVAAAGLVLLVALLSISTGEYVYDEPYYIEGAKLLRQGAGFRELLTAPLNAPAGPLYPLIHWALSASTGLQPPAIRWINPILLAAAIAANCYTIEKMGFPSSWSRSLMILALPPVWVTAGMALTEVPAMALVSFSVAAAAWGMTGSQDHEIRKWVGFVFSALCFGLAVLGRQPYLPAVLGFVAVSVFAPSFRWPAAVAALTAIAIPLPVFAVWGGLVPPHVAFVGGKIDVWHGVLAFGYLSALIAIVAPTYFLGQLKWSLAAALVAVVAVLAAGGSNFPVAAGVAARLPEHFASAFQLILSSSLVAGAAALFVSTGANIWKCREDRVVVLVTLLMTGLAATAAAVVHQFSSRYLMTAFPFALFAVQPFFVPSGWAAIRLAAGILLGYFSLVAYLR